MTDPTDFSLPDPLEDAHDAIRQLAAAMQSVELNVAQLPDTSVSSNLLLGFGDDGYVLVTVIGGNEVTTYVTTGAAADLDHDRLAALEFANARTRENPALPVFLHDGGDEHWDLLVQQSHPTAILTQNPPFLRGMITANIARTVAIRESLAETQIGGRAYEATPEDLQRLAQRAVV
jgi:hypothetical protein